MAIKAIIFDLDGVLYRGNTVMDKGVETLKKLREMGIKVFFLTNSGGRSRTQRAERLRFFGYEAREDEVYTSSYAVAHYISNKKKGASVYCVGAPGLHEQLGSFGLYLTDKKPDFVVVSLDKEINYSKLKTAYRNIIKGSEFVATNDDRNFPVEDGTSPGAGSIVESIAYATNVRPTVLGKPNTYLIDMILEKLDCSRDEILMVGDRVETDIHVAKNAGIKSMLVFSGVTKREDVENIKEEDKPDYIGNDVSDILNLFNHQ